MLFLKQGKQQRQTGLNKDLYLILLVNIKGGRQLSPLRIGERMSNDLDGLKEFVDDVWKVAFGKNRVSSIKLKNIGKKNKNTKKEKK